MILRVWPKGAELDSCVEQLHPGLLRVLAFAPLFLAHWVAGLVPCFEELPGLVHASSLRVHESERSPSHPHQLHHIGTGLW